MNKNRIRLAVLAALMFGLCCAESAADKEDALADAAIRNDVAEVQRLIAEGVDVNARRYGLLWNQRGPALVHAAEYNSVDVAKLLIAAGADVNAANNFDDTALMCAAGKNYVDLARLLIEAGADLNANDNDKYYSTALAYAVRNNSADVARLLIEAGADVNAKDEDGTTALMVAARYGCVDVARLLIEAGADVNAKSNNGMTALCMHGTIIKRTCENCFVPQARGSGGLSHKKRLPFGSLFLCSVHGKCAAQNVRNFVAISRFQSSALCSCTASRLS